MSNNEETSSVLHNSTIYKVVWDKTNGDVWFIDPNEPIESRTNIGQQKPAQSLKEAKQIAKLMLKASGR